MPDSVRKKGKHDEEDTGTSAPQEAVTSRLLAATCDMSRPLTVLTILAPLGILAEIYRFLSREKAVLISESKWAELGGLMGMDATLVPIVMLIIGCLGIQLIKRYDWELPGPLLIGQILIWAAIWAVVRYVIFFTNEQLAGTYFVADSDDQVRAIGQLGLAMSGAIHEELVFRGMLLGGLAALAACWPKGKHAVTWLVCLPLSAVLFALVHTSLLNDAATAFTWATFTRHFLGGLLYGLVFLRQGLATATLAHFGFNCIVMFGLGPW